MYFPRHMYTGEVWFEAWPSSSLGSSLLLLFPSLLLLLLLITKMTAPTNKARATAQPATMRRNYKAISRYLPKKRNQQNMMNNWRNYSAASPHQWIALPKSRFHQ